MNNAKNTYLIAINVTNRQKEKYYHEYVPEVMDSLQDLNESRTAKLNDLWLLAASLEDHMLRQSHDIMDRLAHEIRRNEPHLDSIMYMRHNMGSFHDPPDKEFEASPVWHDDDAMVVDETAKIFLRNVLGKSKSQLGDLRREVDKKRREVEGVKRLKQRVRDGTDNKDEVEVVRNLFAMQEDLHVLDRRRLTAEVETSTITSAVGDVTLGAKNHNFKGQTFKMPTNCDLCGERIWGLSAKGFDCRDCGYTCHSKCEMKVPADCPGEQSKDERKKLKAERQEAANRLLSPAAGPPPHVAELPDLTRSNTMNSLSSHSARRSVSAAVSSPRAPADDTAAPDAPPPLAPRLSTSSASASAAAAAAATTTTATTAPRKNRVVAPPPAAYISELPGSSVNGGAREEKKGKMLYTFEASGDGELTVQEGRDLVLLEPDGKRSSPPPGGVAREAADSLWQMAPAGSRCAPGTRRASCPRRTPTSRRRPRRPRAPRPPTPTRRRRRLRRRAAAAAAAAARGKRARPWRPGAGPRSSGTSRRSTGTRRRARASTPWWRASASSSSRTTRATAGSRWRRPG